MSETDTPSPLDLHRQILENPANQDALRVIGRVAPPYVDPEMTRELPDTLAYLHLDGLLHLIGVHGQNGEMFKENHRRSRGAMNELAQLSFDPVANAAYDILRSGEIPALAMYRYTFDDFMDLRVSDVGVFYGHMPWPNETLETNLAMIHSVSEGQKWWPAVQQRAWLAVDFPHYRPDNMLLFHADVSDLGGMRSRSIAESDYGYEFSRRLTRAYATIALAIHTTPQPFVVWEQRNPGVVPHLVRARDQRYIPNGSGRAVSQYTATEGVLSILQSVVMLTQQKAGDYPDPAELVRHVLADGIVEELARKIPFGGVLGPMSLTGLTFADMLQAGQLSPALLSTFRRSRADIRDVALLSDFERMIQTNGNEMLGVAGCPAAYNPSRQPSVVQRYCNLFLNVFEQL